MRAAVVRSNIPLFEVMNVGAQPEAAFEHSEAFFSFEQGYVEFP